MKIYQMFHISFNIEFDLEEKIFPNKIHLKNNYFSTMNYEDYVRKFGPQ